MRKSLRNSRFSLAAGLLLVAAFSGALTARAQFGSSTPSVFSGQNPEDPAEVQHRIHLYNLQRQKEMTSEAERLIELTAQLKAEMAASPSNQLNAAQQAKLAQIEKLARKLRETMTMTPLAYQNPIPVPIASPDSR